MSSNKTPVIRNQKIHGEQMKIKKKKISPKSLGRSKSSSKREVGINTGLPQEKRKISNKLSNLTCKRTRKRKTKPKASRRDNKDKQK